MGIFQTAIRNTFMLSSGLLVMLSACDGRDTEERTCRPSLTKLSPTSTEKYSIDAGRVVRFHAESKACIENLQYGVRWMLDDRIVAYANDYDYIACNEDEGGHRLSAQAITYAATTTASIEKVVASHTWALTVKGVAKPQPPKCYAQSIHDVRNTNVAGDPAEQKKLVTAIRCLDGYLKTYACDFRASYATGLAKAALFAESFYPLYQRRASLTVNDVKLIVTRQIEPIRQNFLVVKEKAPDDFSFTVDGRFRIFAFHDDPKLKDNDTIYFDAYGHHDKSEAVFIATVMNFFDGGLNVGLANLGTLEFGLKTPDDETPVTLSNRVITALEADKRFLTFDDGNDADGKPLNDGSGAEGKRLIAISQNSFVQGVNSAVELFRHVQSEDHDQTSDLVRYWDCGADAICPATCSYMENQWFNEVPGQADLTESDGYKCDPNYGYRDKNMNAKCDDGWVKADPGECNKKYDDGEALGTERIGWDPNKKPDRLGPSFEIPKVLKVLEMVRDNIRGPDYLDLDAIGEILGAPPKIVSGTLKGLEIPYPMIRISEFFREPTQFRDFVPLYDRKAKQFLVGLENEPFSDVGYDGLIDAAETGYDRITKRDPNFDDMDPYCNPDCNQQDGKDNDGDGKIDGNDSKYGIPKDLGVEGNFVFDFIDMKDSMTGDFNKLHDTGEVHEPFQDVGTLDASGRLIGKGDEKWNKADRAHDMPSGSNVGPVTSLDRRADPPNGTLMEQPDGLVDPYYYFLQDPVMSGAVRFVKDPYKLDEKYESAAGDELTDNALLQRFASKVLELAADPPGFEPVRESNAHFCELNIAQCNHWANPSMGYQ